MAVPLGMANTRVPEQSSQHYSDVSVILSFPRCFCPLYGAVESDLGSDAYISPTVNNKTG